MRPIDVVRIAARRIRARFLESLLVVLGVALGVGVIASTLSLYNLVTSSMGAGREAQEIVVRVGGDEIPRAASVAAVGTGSSDNVSLDPDDIDAVRAAAPDVAHAYFRGLFALSKESREVVGIVAGDYFDAFDMRAAAGAFFTPADEASGARVAILGARKALLLFPSGSAVGSSVTLMGLDYSIVGVLEPATGEPGDGFHPDDLAFVPLRSSVVFEKIRSMPSITFLARSVETVPAAVRQVRSWYDSRYGPGAVGVSARIEEIEQERGRIRGVLAVLLVFGGAGLLVASTNMLNVLLSRAARRVRATGIEVALGQRRSGIFGMTLVESLSLGGAGCLLGVACAVGLNALLAQLFAEGVDGGSTPVLTPSVALAAAAAALVLNLALAVYPAWRAAGTNAADAIRAD